MPGRGPAPNPERRRRNKDETPSTPIAPGRAEAPELPGADGLRLETVQWYATWAESAQAAAFLSTDWQRLHMLARIVDRYYADPSTKDMAEIRLNEERLGATVADRLRSRMVLEEETKATPARSVKASDPRARLRAVE